MKTVFILNQIKLQEYIHNGMSLFLVLKYSGITSIQRTRVITLIRYEYLPQAFSDRMNAVHKYLRTSDKLQDITDIN